MVVHDGNLGHRPVDGVRPTKMSLLDPGLHMPLGVCCRGVVVVFGRGVRQLPFEQVDLAPPLPPGRA